MMAWAAAALAFLLLGLAIYPGELSWISRRGTRWLYDRSARGYTRKYARHDYGQYDRWIEDAARTPGPGGEPLAVLDLGCGSGRATLAAARVLGGAARYTAVDFAPAMLTQFRADPLAQTLLASGWLRIEESDIASWLARDRETYALVLLMEVGEFLPEFAAVIDALGARCGDGAALVMTRPAGLWARCFPLRSQSRNALARRLRGAGFEDLRFSPWRGRYELLRCRRSARRQEQAAGG